ncbi:hypothetical protein DL93DRAFT_2166599 [Clavulina sp. PMI_390]|nr:hypothetical protein DL93DRAFT_2166599 [Clavulina sp. PMI_390]
MAYRYTFFDPMVDFEKAVLDLVVPPALRMAYEAAAGASAPMDTKPEGASSTSPNEPAQTGSEDPAKAEAPQESAPHSEPEPPAPIYEETPAPVNPSPAAPLEPAHVEAKLGITGQGVIAVNTAFADDSKSELLFTLYAEDSGTLNSPFLHFLVTSEKFELFYDFGVPPNSPGPVLLPPSVGAVGANVASFPGLPRDDIKMKVKPNVDWKLLLNDTDTYWLSLDKNNGYIRFGQGYMNMENVALEAELKRRDEEKRVDVWIEKKYEFLEKLNKVIIRKGGSDLTPITYQIHNLPLVLDHSPYVLSDQAITLRDIESNIYTVPANLPPACQQLYANVCGASIRLEDESFPDFAEAIQWSVSAEGRVGYELLKKKATEFEGPPNFQTTYLRITLGHSLGNSPGQPYVMEVWPAGHHSPIHDHGNSCAIIKCLAGEIQCEYFDDLKSPRLLGPPVTFKKGDVTWIGANNYQVHRLTNVSQSVCVTIQCYQYDHTDVKHYGGFRYIQGEQGSKDPPTFNPDSDMTFLDFRKAILKEWLTYKLANLH